MTSNQTYRLNILLALAWAALQGEITLVNLLVGYVVSYATGPGTLTIEGRRPDQTERFTRENDGSGEESQRAAA